MVNFLIDFDPEGNAELRDAVDGVEVLVEDHELPVCGLTRENAPDTIEYNPGCRKWRGDSVWAYSDNSLVYGYELDVSVPNESPFNLLFCEILVHEARHLWQIRYWQQSCDDADGDRLCATTPASWTEGIDSGHVNSGGLNRDFNYLGPNQTDSDMNQAYERDAARFGSSSCGLPRICVINSPPEVIDAPLPTEGQPLDSAQNVTVLVTQSFDGPYPGFTKPLGGVSVLWRVDSGNCQLDCGDPCYTTTHYDNMPPIDPNVGYAEVSVSSSEPGSCVVKFSVVSSVNPPGGPDGTIECTDISQEGEINILYSN